MQLELELGAEVQAARHRQLLDAAQAQRRATLHVVLLVEAAQLALGLPGGAAQALGRALRQAERGLGKHRSGEQMVPVAVGGQQPGHGKAGLLEDRREGLELIRVDRRVDDEALLAGAHGDAGGLPDPADEDEDVLVEGDPLM